MSITSMIPSYDDGQAAFYQGHVLDVLAALPEESVHCIATSPPYYGQRDYELPPMVWGGSKDCQHEWQEAAVIRRSNDSHPGLLQEGSPGSLRRDIPAKYATCSRCAAWRGSLGLEPTPTFYVQHMVEVFRAVRRVLRRDGVLLLNIADSYAGSGGAHAEGHANPGISNSWERNGVPHWGELGQPGNYLPPPGLKAGDMMDIPGDVVRALRADGWWWRSDIIWEKPSAMPESVSGPRWEQHRIKTESTRAGRRLQDSNHHAPVGGGRGPLPEWADCPGCKTCEPNDGLVLRWGNWRPTSSYEHVFLLSRSDHYFCDQEAARQLASSNSHGGPRVNPGHKQEALGRQQSGRLGRWTTEDKESGANLRDVWRINPEPTKDPHFAVFPSALARLMIQIGTSERGCCPECGAPWARVMQKDAGIAKETPKTVAAHTARGGVGTPTGTVGKAGSSRIEATARTLGWRPTCQHRDLAAVPCTVLDPFVGSGTTCWAAKQLGRRSIGIELSEKYLRIAVRRVRQMALILQETESG